MAEWKKVIVSGSDAELREVNTSSHITASGIISASGKLYGNLDENSDQTYVVVYNTVTGELEYKELNLVNVQRAPELFMVDIDDDDKETDVDFKLSFDSGSPTIPTNAPYKFSASLDGGSTFSVTSSVYDVNNYLNINSSWFTDDVDDIEYYNPNTDSLGSSKTASFSEGNTPGPKDVMSGILYGANRQDIILHLQSHGTSTNYAAVPAYTPGPAYANRAFEAPIHGDTGSIQVYLNNTETPVAEFSLTGSGNPAIITEVANIIPDISPSGSAFDSDGTTVDATKTWRSGSITIEAEAQQDGYNFAYTFYTGSRGTTQIRALTNFVHWFYDTNGASANLTTIDGDTISTLAFDDVNQTSSISGIRFWANGAGDTITHKAGVGNFYTNIYPTAAGIRYEQISTNTIDNINVTKKGSHVTTATQNKVANDTEETYSIPSLQDIDNAHTSTLNVTSSVIVNMPTDAFQQPTDFQDIAGSALDTGADIKFNVEFAHIASHKSPSTKTGTTHHLKDYMVNSLTNASTQDDFENFRTENFRILNQSYASSDNPGDSSYDWDGKESLINTGTTGYKTSAAQYYSHLIYPTKCGNNGVFTTTYGPNSNQPDYSSTYITGERVYLRYFRTTQTQAGPKTLNFEFKGSGKIVAGNYTGGGTTHIFMDVWRNAGGTNSNMNGTFTDVYNSAIYDGNTITNVNTQFVNLVDNVNNIDFNKQHDVGGTLMRRSVITVNDSSGNGFSENEEVIIRLRLPQGFTGYIDSLALQYGAATNALLGTSGYTTY